MHDTGTSYVTLPIVAKKCLYIKRAIDLSFTMLQEIYRNMFPLLILIATLISTEAQVTGRRVCYFTNWSQYRPGDGKYLAEHINATLCTHIAISFAKITDYLGPYEWNDESTAHRKGTFEKIVDLKKTNPDLKVLISVGGWNAHSVPFKNVLQSPSKTQKFATQAAQYIRSNGMDGIDVDWEYPTNKIEYNTFIKSLKDAFISEARESGRKILLLTSAVPAGKDNIDRGFDVPYVANLMDFITVMTYDLHGAWETVTGHHSAMYAGHWEKGSQRYLNVDWIMNYWHRLGVPKSKLVLGLPTYGRCFTLQSAFRNGVNVPTKGPGKTGKYTRQGGFLSYYEMCQMLQQGAIKKYISDQKVPYLVKGDQWCGFDDTESLKMKVKYMKSTGFGGIAVWSLDMDDFGGQCGTKYPLLTAIFEEMNTNTSSTDSTVASPEKELPASVDYEATRMMTSDVWVNSITTSTMKPVKTTKTTKKTEGPCTDNKNGIYPDALNCQTFWICIPGAGGYKHVCPPKTLFDDSIKTCNHENMVRCKNSTGADPCVGNNVGYMADSTDCQKFWMCFHGRGYSKTCPTYTMWNQGEKVCDWADNVICSPSSQI